MSSCLSCSKRSEKPKTPFVDNQEKAARRRARDFYDTYAFWFRRRYNLPPLDPRFLAMTPEDVEAEYWAYYYLDNPPGDEYEDESFDADLASLMDDPAQWESLIDDRPNN